VLADKKKDIYDADLELSWNGTFTKRSTSGNLFPAHVGWHRDHPDCDIAHRKPGPASFKTRQRAMDQSDAVFRAMERISASK